MERKISVIVPVYNVEQYLERCLNSIIENTYRKLEIICVNDGSVDGCATILRRYAMRDGRIKVISKENRGLSSARNIGLKYCTGEFVAFIDADDWIHNNYFSVLMEVQKRKDYDVVSCAHIRTALSDVFGEEPNVGRRIKERNRYQYMMNNVNKSYVWGRIYKRQCVEGLTFDEKEKIEDSMFNIMVAQRNPQLKTACLDQALYAYFVREGSLVSLIDFSMVLRLAEKYYEYAQIEYDREMKDIFLIESIKRCMASRYAYQMRGDKEKVNYCNELAEKCLRKIKRNKIRYTLIVNNPIIYRAFRIITDPTMLEWERNVKDNKVKV